jgi:hypothetical protein
MRFCVGTLTIVLSFCATTPTSAADFTGFWKGDCSDAFGVQIKPYSGTAYSVSFCGPGGCFSPGSWKPNTPIVGDPSYRVVNEETLELRNGERWQRYTKCTSDTNPKLDYSTMPQPSNTRSTDGGVRFKPYYEGIPDYEKTTVFQVEPISIHSEIRALLRKASAGSSFCVRGYVKATVVPPHALRTNICESSSYLAIETAIAKIAPSLDRQRWTFRQVDLDGDGEPELIVEYVDLIGDASVKDPYLSLWHLRFDGTVYRPTYAGPFLVGGLHGQMAFGQTGERKVVFVRHSSCTECHPWVYLTIVDFFSKPNGAAFEFTYAGDHKSFKYDIEYILPGMGHSIDAKVETRALPATLEGPHLMQQFRLNNGKTEWWVFRCADMKCDYEMFDELPNKYRSSWQSGRKL